MQIHSKHVKQQQAFDSSRDQSFDPRKLWICKAKKRSIDCSSQEARNEVAQFLMQVGDARLAADRSALPGQH